MKDLSPTEAGRWLEAAPPAIQDAVTSSATGAVIEQMGTKYGLHIDVVGTLYKLVTYMLVGYIDPPAFLRELSAAGIKDADAQQIIKEVNDKIFTPLQQKMRTQESGEVTAPPIAAPLAPTPAPAKPVATPVPPAPKIPMPPVATINHAPLPTMSTPLAEKTLNRLAPTPPGAPVPRPAPPAPRPAVVTSGLSAALKNAGVQLLEDHEEPHIEFRKPASTPIAPARAPLPTSSPLPKPMTAGTFTTPPAPTAPRPPMSAPIPSVPLPMPKPPAPTMPASTTYTVDPYREAPEAHEK